MAERRLGTCLTAGKGRAGKAGRQLLSAPLRQLGGGLQEAYTHLWKLQLAEGWSKLQVQPACLPFACHLHLYRGCGQVAAWVFACKTNQPLTAASTPCSRSSAFR